MFINRCRNAHEMSNCMKENFINHVHNLLGKKSIIRVAIATGSTLEEFIGLLYNANIPLQKLIIYVVDEYSGIDFWDSRSCCIDLINALGKSFNKIHSLKTFSKEGYIEEIATYNNDLIKNGLDICVLGVGNDGHIGFCYPPIIEQLNEFYVLLPLDDMRKKEHIDKGWFKSIREVPDTVITLSLWGMFQASVLMVGAICDEKKDIIPKLVLQEDHYKNCPVLYLCQHNNLTIYVG